MGIAKEQEHRGMTVQQGGVKVRKPYFCEVYCLSLACPRCSDSGDGVKICEQEKQRGVG